MIRTAIIAIAATTSIAAHAEPLGWQAMALAGLERTDAAPGAGASNGFYYGGQLGYHWRAGPVIAGIEADLGGSTASASIGPFTADQDLFASVAARVALPLTTSLRGFVRGGVAYHRIRYRGGRSDFDGTGWTLGGGAELDLSRKMFLRGEYRFNDYGRTVRGQQFLGGIGLRF